MILDDLLRSDVTYGKNSQRIYASQDTNRDEDGNRFLTITDCVLTCEAVNDYSGAQIAEKYHRQFDIQLNKIYKIYRPLEEIEKSKDTYNLKALTDDHIAITPESPAQHRMLGTSGESVRIEGRELLNTIAIWNGKGRQYIEDADKGLESGKKDLSCGYAYELVKEPGIFDGTPYDFKMVNLRCNHIALVKKGRVEGAQIADSDDNIISKGVQIVKKKLTGVGAAISYFFDSGKAKDNKEKMMDNEKIMRAMKEVAGKDASEFEGGEDEQGKTIMEMAKSIHDMNEPKSKQEDSDEPDDKPKAKDNKDCPAKDEFEPKAKEPEAGKALKKVAADNAAATPNMEPKDKIMDSMALDALIEKKVSERITNEIRNRAAVHNLCTKVVGQLSDELLMDADLENVVNETLRLKGLKHEGRSIETKLAMLEVAAAGQQSSSANPFFNDSARVTTTSINNKKPAPSIMGAMKGRK